MTANTQLSLLQNALVQAGANAIIFPTYTNPTNADQQSQPVQNLMIVALNKIVWNTYATANNTGWSLAAQTGVKIPGGSTLVRGTYASGGWITGGIPGRDSVPLASGGLGMPGEFVVRNEIAQPNKSWLDDFNRTGRVPIPTISARGGGNDNGEIVAELRSVKAELANIKQTIAAGSNMVAQTTAQGASAVVDAVETGTKKHKQDIRMKSRDQRAG